MSFLATVKHHNRPFIMGILNVTPDSFSDGGAFIHPDSALKQALKMIEDGADIIDIGGESTKPGALAISIDEESQRVLPLIQKLKEYTDIALSVDTSKPIIMKEAISFGIDMVNDVCALQETGALEAVADSKVDICLMHKKGTPKDMQNAPQYENIFEEINAFFSQRIDACNYAKIDKSRLCLDPGFGFAKTLDHNYQLLNHLNFLNDFKLPILSGTSRKSMIGNLCNADVSKRLSGSITTAILAVQKNAKIIRVHDVFETKQARIVLDKTQQS